MKGHDFMKFKKFQSIAKNAGQIEIIQIKESKLQFLNNGYTVYPVHKLPELNNEMIFALLDIDEKKRDDYAITRVNNTSLNYNDIDETEEPVVSASFTIKFANLDNTVRPVFTRRGLYYYDPKWLEPFEGDYDSLFIRCDNNFDSQPYIAVKSGIFIVGFIILRNLNLQLKMFANKSNEDLRTLCSMLEVIE